MVCGAAASDEATDDRQMGSGNQDNVTEIRQRDATTIEVNDPPVSGCPGSDDRPLGVAGDWAIGVYAGNGVMDADFCVHPAGCIEQYPLAIAASDEWLCPP